MVFVPLINLKIVTCSWPSAQVHFTIHTLKLPCTLKVNVNTLIHVCTRVACLVINVHYCLLYIIMFFYFFCFSVSFRCHGVHKFSMNLVLSCAPSSLKH